MSLQIAISRRNIQSFNELVLRSMRTVVRTVPAITKWLAILLFLLNIRSWPLMWHFRVFKPIFIVQAKLKLLKWRTMHLPKAVRDKRVDEWLEENLTPIGRNPFEMLTVWKARATLDECDYNLHLSNSSYAKILDHARFELALAMFPRFFGCGGRVALGGTHFTFIREIPILAQYEVRTTVTTWNQKWLFSVHRFVSKSKGRKSKETAAKPAETPDKPAENITMPLIATPVDATASIANTPFSSTPNTTSTQETSSALKAAAASLASSEEPDGAVLHTIAVSEVCFKIGRITVPPALVLAINGLSSPPSEFGSVLASYSRTNPPPHWPEAKALMSLPAGGSPKTLKQFLSGKWRDVPESEKWWDAALCGAVEEKRKAGLEIIGGVRLGMEGAQSLTPN